MIKGWIIIENVYVMCWTAHILGTHLMYRLDIGIPGSLPDKKLGWTPQLFGDNAAPAEKVKNDSH